MQVSEKAQWQGRSTLSLTCFTIQSCKYNRIHYFQKGECLIIFPKQRNFIRNHNMTIKHQFKCAKHKIKMLVVNICVVEENASIFLQYCMTTTICLVGTALGKGLETIKIILHGC
jgi:hypothetical protein